MTEKQATDLKAVLGTNLRVLRRIHDLTMKEVCELTGLSNQTLKNYEMAESIPNALVLYDLATVYNVSIDKLFDPELAAMWDAFIKKLLAK